MVTLNSQPFNKPVCELKAVKKMQSLMKKQEKLQKEMQKNTPAQAPAQAPAAQAQQ